MPRIGRVGVSLVLLALLGAGSFTFTACAPHHVSPQGTAAFDDTTITTRVKTVLLNDPQVGALKIDVNTSQGVVTLSGTARNKAEADKAVQLAKGVQGVKDVRSNLQVGG
jgi:osmotically-inducible protein OsmY